MKVKQLMEKLAEVPQDVEIRVEMLDGSIQRYGDVTDIEFEDDTRFGDGLEFVYIIVNGD